jgi:starch synthase
LYHYTLPGGARRDYADNCARFCFFNRAVLEVIRLLDFWPDILHNHDWQTGMVPVFLQEVYRRFAPPGLRERYEGVRTVFTIHNIAYQGCFRPPEFPLTGLDWRLFNHRQLEFYGQLSFLKAGIQFADWVTTVSPTYAREIQTPEFGYGMQGVATERRERLSGIVNGADYREWDPATDPHLPQNYTVDTLQQGKPACKAALQKRHGLAEDPHIPVIGMIARLVDQKGVDLVLKTADAFLRGGDGGTQFIVLGEGDPVYHRLLQELRDRHADRIGLTLGFDETLAHQIEAGADMYLMPSQYEPSGLNQLYSLRYGTIPIVRATGGLADTIVDYSPETLEDGSATGFRFVHYLPGAFLTAVQRAVNLYRQEPAQWQRLQQNAMRQDWSWNRSAAEYEKVYEGVK